MEPNENSQKDSVINWRTEKNRVIIIIIVVLSHMFLYSGLVGKGNMVEYVMNWDNFGHVAIFFAPVGISMGLLIYISGHMYGRKKEFEEPESLNKVSYFAHVKKRFIRLYTGYYIALFLVFIAKLISNFPMNITPLSLIFELTNLWGMILGTGGSIWPEGWFISTIFWLSVLYPFIRRLMVIDKRYVYFIIAITWLIRYSLFAFVLITQNIRFGSYLYCHPLSWIGEYCLGLVMGKSDLDNGTGSTPAKTKNQKIFVKMGARVFPLYLVHSAVIVFISFRAPFWEYIIASFCIVLLAEGVYRLLKIIN